jgi:inner membrane protein
MEPVTHFLTGACMGRAGLNRTSRWATATLVLAAEAPDLDIFYSFINRVRGFEFHRNYTHTFIGIPVVAGVVVAFMYGLYRWRRRKHPDMEAPRWGVLYGLALLAGCSHILLDFTNNYGVVPFMPFSYRWISWDIVFIYEPLLWLFLIGGLVLPGLFGLITQEVGYRKPKYRGQKGAITALVLMVALWGVRAYEHDRALDAMNGMTFRGEEPISLSAYPYPLNFFHWYGVAETPSLYEVMSINSNSGRVDAGRNARVVYKPEQTAITDAAERSLLGRIYLWWAKYPVTETEEEMGPGDRVEGYVVHFYDMRFMRLTRDRSPLGAWVELDKDLRVVGMGFRERQPQLGRMRTP